VFNQYQLIRLTEESEGMFKAHPNYQNLSGVLLYLGEIYQMEGHCVISNRSGEIVWGFHTDSFEAIPEDEL